MIEINWARAATVPRPHQITGAKWLLRKDEPEKGRVIPYVSFLGDRVGVGKSKQVVDAAEVLYEAGEIDTVLSLCPAAGRGVWQDPDPALGEVAKHGWPSIENHILEYSVRRSLLRAPSRPGLLWIVANYELIRRVERLLPLAHFLQGRRYWLVPDESWALADHTTAQWEAVAALRHHGWIAPKRWRRDPKWKEIRTLGLSSARITLLNGTPVADTPLDLFAQGRLLHSTIPGFQFYSHFRARYAQLVPNVNFPMISGWQNLEELRARFEPYSLAREVEQCEVLDPVLIESKLTPEDWKLYVQMRDEMIAWLDDQTASVAKLALSKGIRLAQITSGFLGGVAVQFNPFDDSLEEDPDPQTREIGRAKLDSLIELLARMRPPRVVIWSRFRPEVERTARELRNLGHFKVFTIEGNQSPTDRQNALRALNPDIPQDTPVALVANAAAGGAAINLSGASLDVTLSDYASLRIYQQKRGRINRGTRRPIQYVDIVAVGPRGQRTVNHHILAALRSKEDVAAWTTATWRKKLLED